MSAQGYEVQLFGPYADAVGDRVVHITFPEQVNPTAAELLEAIGREQPQLRAMMNETRLAVNQQFATADQTVQRSDELALIGLVAGG